jgi:NitT/TauT family transport system ATP-binding protein
MTMIHEGHDEEHVGVATGGRVELRNVGVTFESARAGEVEAVRDVSIALDEGRFGALVGPSGSGKSTLLRVVAGLLAPTTGTVTIGGAAPELARRRRQVGFAFQDPTLLGWRNVRANLELPFQLSHRPVDQDYIDRLLELTNLADAQHRRPRELSGGMRQRVALARALVTRPTLLLLDEPFGALDELTRTELNFELLNVVAETRPTVLLVTHSLEEAALLADEVFVLGARPGHLRAHIEVPYGRPRTPRTYDADSYHDTCRAIREALGITIGARHAVGQDH